MPTRLLEIGIVYKNFAAHKNISHIGLGVAAINTAKVLQREGIAATVWPALSTFDLRKRLGQSEVTHLIISAPWIPTLELNTLANDFPATQFYVCCHSNIGFLQADRNGMHLIRELLDLEMGTYNVHLAGNSLRFCHWIESAFARPCAYLPNLYYLDEHAGSCVHNPPVGSSGSLRIGIFGATRPLKNLMTAAAAAIDIARGFRMPLELWLSAGRAEGGGDVVLASLKEMISGLPHVTLKFNGWQSWPQFRQTVAHMHLLLQPSYTESFNMVTADGIAEGVPSVVSDAIDWMPLDTQAACDDALAIARVGRRLLLDPHAAQEGLKALHHYVKQGIHAYRRILGN